MSYSVVRFSGDDTTYHADFLSIPQKLYSWRRITQDYAEEMAILQQTHPLSHYFNITGFLVYNESQPVARTLLFDYPDDTRGYVGYYDCYDDDIAAKMLFDEVANSARELSKTSLFGPYNASFWLHYRLKLDRFTESPYMGEPHNLPYYERQFTASGYRQTITYISSEYGLSLNTKKTSEFTAAKQRANTLDYKIKSPKPAEFMTTLEHCYMFFSTLYADFPGYKPITQQEFVTMFQSLAPVLNYRFVKFAYIEDQVVGFVIGFPDYGNLLHRPMTLINKFRILARKIRAPRYIVMYLGVLPEHSGLGRALVRPLAVSAFLRGAKVIGALAREDKVTAKYGQELIRKQYRYGMFERDL